MSVRPIIRPGGFLRELRVERMRLDERAVEAVNHRVQPREDQRVAFLDAHETRAVERHG